MAIVLDSVSIVIVGDIFMVNSWDFLTIDAKNGADAG